jgi:hypothetical protein
LEKGKILNISRKNLLFSLILRTISGKCENDFRTNKKPIFSVSSKFLYFSCTPRSWQRKPYRSVIKMKFQPAGSIGGFAKLDYMFEKHALFMAGVETSLKLKDSRFFGSRSPGCPVSGIIRSLVFFGGKVCSLVSGVCLCLPCTRTPGYIFKQSSDRRDWQLGLAAGSSDWKRATKTGSWQLGLTAGTDSWD